MYPPPRLLLALLTLLALALLTPGPLTRAQAEPVALQPQLGAEGLLYIDFAPGTPRDYIRQIYSAMQTNPELDYFRTASHWSVSATARQTGGSNQGDSLILTWSLIPDGTWMPAQFSGDSSCSSNLIAQLNSSYGAGSWQAEIERVFASWAAKSGLQFVRELGPSGTGVDDGASWPNSSGVQGVRGDIRIGGCTIDGDYGILAYNYYPSNGDMKIDATDAFFDNAGDVGSGFHNVMAHEVGHGLGLAHVCPVNETKLMEPFITRAFIGPQQDDLRGVQRHYGDRYEVVNAPNDSAANATNLGTPAIGSQVSIETVSIDDNNDQDWYRFSVDANRRVSIDLIPVGSTYLEGPQNSDGSCSAGTAYNAATVHNLGFQVLDSNGSTVLATVNAVGAGQTEQLLNQPLNAAGHKYIRVFGDTTDSVQQYTLRFTVRSASAGGGQSALYLSSSTGGSVGGVTFADEDILVYDPNMGTWAIYVDGSDIGITGDIDALHIEPDGTLLLSLDAPATLPGVGRVDDSDVIRFTPSQLGPTTAGVFSLYLIGADVGLTTNGEDIDALDRAADGALLVSILGSGSVPKSGGGTITVADEDLIKLNPADNRWSLHFDGSDVQLSASSEDLWGASTDPATGILRLTTAGAFNVGLTGNAADVLACAPGSYGPSTTCTYSLYWDGDPPGWAGEITDALYIGAPPADMAALGAATADAAALAPEQPELNDESEDLLDDPAIVGEEEETTEDDQNERLFLPNIAR
jgi:hypothetical protein